MKELQERIVAEGQVIGNNILKVDAFLNHQIDPQFILRLGADLAGRFKSEGVTKVLTVEASGIAVAMAAALSLGCIAMKCISLPSAFSGRRSTG